MLITGDDIHGITLLTRDLHAAFTIKDLSLAHDFLGIELARPGHSIILDQIKCIHDILSDAGITGAKLAKLPLPKCLHLSAETGEIMDDPGQFRRLIGRLLYLTLTRPNISYSV